MKESAARWWSSAVRRWPRLVGRSTRETVIYRWDLDKTYLQTNFDSLRGLVRIPFESARDKVAVPAVPALIRGLRDTAERRGVAVRVVFLTASPPQIAKAILEKLELDGVRHDGVVFKDQWKRIVRGKFRDLREQVGYKLCELFRARVADARGAREFLFGDDWESDPLIYSLYSDIVAGRLSSTDLVEILRALHVDAELVESARELAVQLPGTAIPERIFIHLSRATPPAQLRGYGVRLVPVFNAMQSAACLFDLGVLDRNGLIGVARALCEEHGFSARGLRNSLSDVVRRGHLGEAADCRARRLLDEAGVVEGVGDHSRWRELRIRSVQCVRGRSDAGVTGVRYFDLIASGARRGSAEVDTGDATRASLE